MRNQQAGGVVSFIIVAVALTGLLVGGLYLSKSQGRAARESDSSTPQVAAPAKDESKTKEPAKEEKPAPATPSTSQPQTQNQGTASPQSALRQQTPASQTPSTSQNRVAATGPSDTLPSTGPGEAFATVLALGALTFTASRFVSARRSVRSAALNR